MTEQERINSIKSNGGRHLQNFKLENITYEMCCVAVEKDGAALCFVPDKFLTKEVYEKACQSTGSMLSKVPSSHLTKKMCELAVQSDGLALEYVPEKFITEKICFLAACENPLAFQRMPENYITVEFVSKVIKKTGVDAVVSLPKAFKNSKFYLPLVEVCPEIIWKLPKAAHTAALSKACLKAMKCKSLADAVKNNPEFLSQVHPSLYDYEACLTFVTSSFFIEGVNKKDYIGPYSGFNTDSDNDKGLFYMNRMYDSPYSIPHMAKWPDICLALVSANSAFLRYIKPEILTADMCMKAVKADKYGYIIDDIPDEFKSKELCLLAFDKDPYNIQYFPDEFITMELVIKAVKHTGYVLEHIADKYKTKEVCLIAVSNEGTGKISEVPEEVLDKEICLAWIKNTKWAVSPLKDIPERFRDYDVCYACVSRDGDDLKNVPNEYIDEKMCLAAAKKSSGAARYIPVELFTHEMAEAIAERSFVGFEHIAKHALTEKACLFALKQSGNCSSKILESIPDDMITQEMCDIAVQQHTWGLKAVPERFVTEDMLISVAKRACGVLTDNFPERFRTKEFIEKLESIEPGCSRYIRKYIE